MSYRARPLVCPLLVGLVGLVGLGGLLSGCAGQQGAGNRGGGEAGAPAPSAADVSAPPAVSVPAPAAHEWRSAGCATPRSPVVMHTAGIDMPLTDQRTQDLATKVTQAGEGQFAAVYAGLELTPDQLRLIVYRKPSAEFDAYLRTAAGDGCLMVRDAPHSQAELLALVHRISDDFGYWRKRGIAINSVGPNHDGTGVEVGTQNITAAQVELPMRYGMAVPIKVVEQGPIVPAIGKRPPEPSI
jgi:hypothetical protein